MVEKTGFFLSKNVDYFTMKGRKSVFSSKKGPKSGICLKKMVHKTGYFLSKKWIYLKKKVEKVNNH